ncbi:MAG: Crp/Fnr family transcriptional regulator [Flavobacteriales bacterium]
MQKELDQFLKFINNFVPLSDTDVAHMIPEIQLVELEKKEILLNTNQKCRGIYYLIEGLIRIYSIKGGNEVNNEFLSENEFFTDYESLMTNSTCMCTTESIEKTRLLFLPYDKLIESYDKSHMLERLGRLMVERAFSSYIAKNNAAHNLKTDEKYNDFESQFPALVNRIPIKHLATYFGIAPESLSRIRKSRVKSIS